MDFWGTPRCRSHLFSVRRNSVQGMWSRTERRGRAWLYDCVCERKCTCENRESFNMQKKAQASRQAQNSGSGRADAPRRPSAQGRMGAKHGQTQETAPRQKHDLAACEQLCCHGGPVRTAKARQRRGGHGVAGAHSTRHSVHECRYKTQTLQSHVTRGMPAKGSSRAKEEGDETSRDSPDGT